VILRRQLAADCNAVRVCRVTQPWKPRRDSLSETDAGAVSGNVINFGSDHRRTLARHSPPLHPGDSLLQVMLTRSGVPRCGVQRLVPQEHGHLIQSHPGVHQVVGEGMARVHGHILQPGQPAVDGGRLVAFHTLQVALVLAHIQWGDPFRPELLAVDGLEPGGEVFQATTVTAVWRSLRTHQNLKIGRRFSLASPADMERVSKTVKSDSLGSLP